LGKQRLSWYLPLFSTHQQPAPEQQVGKMCRGCSRAQRSVGKTKVELVFAALQHTPAACTEPAGG